MRDYLNSSEKNQFMVLQALLQQMEGKRRNPGDGSKIGTMREEWLKRNNITKEEHKNLKTAETFLRKFITSVYYRLDPKEREIIDKKLIKFDFRLIDDFTLKQIYRDTANRMVNAVVPRQQFYDWCKEIMCVRCDGCTKEWNECELHQVFEDNFIPESSFNFRNCKFAYSLEQNKIKAVNH